MRIAVQDTTWIRLLAGATCVASLLTACAPTGRVELSPSSTPPTLVLRRVWSLVDDSLAARGLGRAAIVVRAADRPTQVLDGAELTLVRLDATDSLRIITDAVGFVTVDSLPAGRYGFEARRLGYARGRVEVDVAPGCRVDIEIYLGVLMTGISPPPPMSTRATITTCGPD